jgi:hypothetical protein
MKSKVVAIATLLATVGLTAPVLAQIKTPSQEFFEQGRERLDREIQILRGESPNLEENSQKPQSEPVLEVNPSPVSEPNQQPTAVENSSPKPIEIYNNKSRSL